MLICRERKKERLIKPLHIGKKALKAERERFISIVDDLVLKIKSYTAEELPENKKETLRDFRILSYNGDELGKVFEKDKRIFRGIYKSSVPFFEKLWRSGLLQVLSEEGYIPKTVLSPYFTDEYPLILEHQVVSVSTGKMWNPDMVRDACVCTCIINEVCKRLGYKLIDGHLNNITFHKGRPVFTDIGSIIEDRGQYTSFESSIIFAGAYKLMFAALGNSILDRSLRFDEDNNSYWVAPLQYDECAYEYRYFLRKFRSYHRWHSSYCIRKIISDMFMLHEVRPEYFSLLFDFGKVNEAPHRDYSKDIDAVIKALGKWPEDFASVTDIGGTHGEMPRALEKAYKDKNVTSLESLRSASRDIYRRCKEDFSEINCFEINYLYGMDARTRASVSADVVVAADITGTALAYQNWKVESLFNSLRKISRKYVAVTFHRGKASNKCKDEAVTQSFENFQKCFCSFFDLVDVKPIDDLNAKLYIGRIRGNTYVAETKE